MKHIVRILLMVFLVMAHLSAWTLPGSAIAAGKSTIQVSAAISLKEALEALKGIYLKMKPNEDIRFNLGASGVLQRQIEEGAPVDLFISAGNKQMDDLATKGLIIPGTRKDLLGNELVLIVAREKRNTIKSFADLADNAKSFSIGTPETVPAGKYGKETMTSLKLWDKLEKRIVYANNVRQVLAYVDSGNVDAGLVYRSDTIALKSAVIAAVAPRGSHTPILYPMAVVRSTKNRSAAEKFMEFLKTPAAAKVFATYGFIPLAGNR